MARVHGVVALADRKCSPRMRGWPGTSCRCREHGVDARCSPRMRGWPDVHDRSTDTRARCVPRACGDGPAAMVRSLMSTHGCSPRMRGWPAHVWRRRPSATWCSPRMRGWPAHVRLLERIARMCSPRMRGWPDELAEQNARRSACSPRMRGWPAGRPAAAAACRRVPRACGDGPLTEIITLGAAVVFPAHAGMAR